MADNRAAALQFLRGKGLSRAQAAGVVGSLMQESGLSTTAKNPSSGALGIGQWLGGRKTNLLSRGNAGSLGGQLNFLWSELQGPEKAALQRLKGAHSVEDAAAAFTWGFERPGKAEANMGNRVAQGRAALKLAGGGAVEPTPGTNDTPAQGAPGQQPSMIEALGSLIPQRPQLQVTGPTAPSFAAAGVLPQGYQAPAASAQVAPQRDLTPALQAIDRLRMSATQSVGAQTEARDAREPTANTHLSGSKVLELIFNDGGKGYGIKNGADVEGSQVFSDVWGGHANHVHVAAGPKTVVALGKIAQDKFGLHVGENSHFGGVDAGAHVPGSYHVKDEAIDVSGDPKQMAAYARYVRAYNRSRRQ